MDSHNAALRDQVVAARAAGRSVTAIEQHFGLPHAEVERILAETGARPVGYPPQGPPAVAYGRPEARRPPWPVMVAVALVGSYTVVSCLLRLGAGGFGAYQAGGVVSSLLTALVAYLLWKGRRGAWIVTLILGTLGAVARLLAGDVVGAVVAAAVVLLLVTSESARAWFRS